MIDRNHALSLAIQAQQLGISRGSIYSVSNADLAIMRLIDELHLLYPFAGSRMLRDLLRQEGVTVGRFKPSHLCWSSNCSRAGIRQRLLYSTCVSPKYTGAR